MSNDSLGDRMKRYESASRYTLPWRVPVVVRVDGRAFHTFTRGMQRPFDAKFNDDMNATALAMCADMQGARVAYVQSDEISVLLYPWAKNESMPWFDNDLGKIVSISAALASATLTLATGRLAQFDSRAFVVPERDVCNYFVWRQNDATRNSILSLTQSLYSPKQMHGWKKQQMHEACFSKGVNWDALPTHQKRGRCIVRRDDGSWLVDNEIPIFTQDRDYIERHIAPSEEEAAA